MHRPVFMHTNIVMHATFSACSNRGRIGCAWTLCAASLLAAAFTPAISPTAVAGEPPAANASASEQTGTRDPWQWPFAVDSIWNMPIGSDAVYVPAGLERATNVAIDDELLYRVPADAPLRSLFTPKSWEQRAGGTTRLGEIRIPDNLLVPDARKFWTPNHCAAFLQPDGRAVINVAPLCRVEAGGPVFGYLFDNTDLLGDGIHGSHGGSRMSALGGSIRKGELTGTEPIRHALKVDIFCKKFCYFGEDRKGFRWPAASADGYASSDSYGGKNKAVVMGSLLAIPPDQTPERLGIKTPIGRKLFAALQNYGAYVVDDSAWDCHYFCGEQGVKEEVKTATGLDIEGTSGELFDDINRLFVAMAVIDNNSPGSIGGGGKPRVELAPPFLPDLGSEASGPKLTNGSMTDGADVPDAWTNKWEGSGQLAASRDETTFKKGPAALKVRAVGGAARGQISQITDAAEGDVVRFAGYVKTQGNLTATVGVMTYTSDWRGVEFLAIQQAKADQDWLPFAGTVTLPKTTARCAFAMLVEGDGTAWLDECSSGAEAFKTVESETSAVVPTQPAAPKVAPPPRAENAWSAGEGFFSEYPDAWRTFHNGFVEQAKKGDAQIVFLGDSITQGWGGDGKDGWEEFYAKRKAVNFGIGGDGTPQILWRVQNGTLDGLKPKLVVLMIGTNNRWRGDATADSVSMGIEACVAAIREKVPSAKVLVLGVFPAGEKKDDSARVLFAETNKRIAQLADNKHIFFLDLTNKFLEKDGSISAKIMPDFLHLSPAGYKIWAKGMEPTVKKLLGEK